MPHHSIRSVKLVDIIADDFDLASVSDEIVRRQIELINNKSVAPARVRSVRWSPKFMLMRTLCSVRDYWPGNRENAA
jgi:hypothetical protein